MRASVLVVLEYVHTSGGKVKSSNPQDFEGAVDKRTQVSFEGKNMTGRAGNLLEIAKVCPKSILHSRRRYYLL